MVWQCFYQIVDHKKRAIYILPDPSPWRQSICKFMSKLGDLTTAGRRRSWLFDGLFMKTELGYRFYLYLKHLALYRKRPRGYAYMIAKDRNVWLG